MCIDILKANVKFALDQISGENTLVYTLDMRILCLHLTNKRNDNNRLSTTNTNSGCG